MRALRVGDHVFHARSGEIWEVACVDASRDALSWAGWPEGWARMSDCTPVFWCTDEEHLARLQAWAASENNGRDHRTSSARALLRRYEIEADMTAPSRALRAEASCGGAQ